MYVVPEAVVGSTGVWLHQEITCDVQDVNQCKIEYNNYVYTHVLCRIAVADLEEDPGVQRNPSFASLM